MQRTRMIDVGSISGVPLWQVVLGGVLALVIGAAAAWVLWGRKQDLEREKQRDDVVVLAGGPASKGFLARVRQWRWGLSEPTRLSIGVGQMLTAYHAAAYLFPDQWLAFRIPETHWWVLAIVVVVLVGGSMVMDRLEGRHEM
jgi:hypothetical protein